MPRLFCCCVAWLTLVASAAAQLRVDYDPDAATFTVQREGVAEPLAVMHAPADGRPYLHPLRAADGRGAVTQLSPDHHPHQTGLFWGLTRVNGRDYFHGRGADAWRRTAAAVLVPESPAAGDPVRWQVAYELLDADGRPALRETYAWSLRVRDDVSLVDLQYSGEALVDVLVGQYDYGGLFLRAPWAPGVPARVVNGARQVNARAEGQRAVWLDLGLPLADRGEEVHVALFDHPQNRGFPQAWRVDDQFGVGTAPARGGDIRLAAGETLALRHRVRIAPGPLDDVATAEAWSEFSGQEMAWAQWQLAQQEGREAKLLSPAEAVAAMTVPDGFRVTPFASEPMITQPMAFCWDDRGRLWIAENRDYESRGGGFSASGDSRILILEDVDRDGTADSCRTFLEGIPFPAAIAVGFGGLWLGAPPNLLFVPDRDGDDRADLDAIEVRLTGWGILDRHETLNSFHWGPDGWLYGCQGFATPSRVGKPAGQGKIYRHGEPFPDDIPLDGPGVDINGGVWRYHPLKDRFEVVAHGFSNPWGIDHDAHGQLFATACVIPHLWHIVPGGIYHRQGGSHFNPHVYADLRTIADHRHRSAHGGARIYLSDAFPAAHHGRIFMANIHEHAVLSDVLEPQGSGFVGRHGDDFLLANNAQWIGFSMELGPDGALYVLDWHDADICGKEVLNKDTGRVFRIAAEPSLADEWPGRYGDVAALDDEALVDLLSRPSAWHARRAQVQLQYRAAQRPLAAEAVAELQALLAPARPVDLRLRALWALHATGNLAGERLAALLDDEHEQLRAWTIQLLCEDRDAAPAALERMAQLARSDASPVVRLYLAAALQRVPEAAAWAIAEGLVRHAADRDDHNIPRMTWFGVEPLVPHDPQRALQLAASTDWDDLARWIARRLTAANAWEPLVAALQQADQPRLPLLLGVRDGLEGRRDVAGVPGWDAAYRQLRAAGDPLAEIALQVSLQLGDRTAAAALLELLTDSQADPEQRRAALRGLADRRAAELAPQLVRLLDDPELRTAAIRAVAAYDEPELAAALLTRYEGLSAADRLECVHTLASRSSYGRLLTRALAAEEVPRRDIPAYVARLLQRVVGNGFLEVWGPLDPLADAAADAEARYRALLQPDALAQADLRQGRAVFQRTCAACHTLYGVGGQIGPDITGANRTNLDYLLSNILMPSAVIQEAYRMHVVLTDDGRVYSGIPDREDERSLVLRVASQPDPVALAKSQIEDREIVELSMMPEGLLNALSDAETLALFAYLQSLEQVPLPEE